MQKALMTSQEVTTRKDHDCAACGECIPAGSKAKYYTGREPRFDSEDLQCGIEYVRFWTHLHNCHKPEPCQHHTWTKEMVLDHYVGNWRVGAPTGRVVCTECGTYKDEQPA